MTELMNVQAIRELSNDGILEYKQFLVRAGFDEEIACTALNDIVLPVVEAPLSEYMFNRILKFFRHNFSDITYRIYPTDIAKDCKIVVWSVENTRTHCVFINHEQFTILSNCLLAFEGGTLLEEMANAETTPPGFTQYKPYLEYLGIEISSPLIPNLVDNYINSDATARFSSAVWYNKIQGKTIMLAGLGGIGSYVAFLLARMAPKRLILMDSDRVEEVNMAGQLYSRQDIGSTKVDSISHMIEDYTSCQNITALPERFTEDSEATDIMICGFDNMEARALYFNKWERHVKSIAEEERKHCLFIDGRLAAELLQVLCIRGDDNFNMERYKNEFLFTDREADNTVCSYKQTTYMANMIGSIIVNLFTNFVANEVSEYLRPLPFFTEYNGSIMKLKVEN